MLIKPVDVVLWTFRRNEHDVINLYNSLSPVMQLATGAEMLNFGYWDGRAAEPLAAQNDLCSLVGKIAELDSGRKLVDAGSGLSAPAEQWKSNYSSLDIVCVDINFNQLLLARQTKIPVLNAACTALPFSDNSADRIIALESAQHFRPLWKFVNECWRVLQPGGLLVVAIPVVTRGHSFFRLGMLSWTWSSEHYELESVKSIILRSRFQIDEAIQIGHQVYEPLADFYVRNRSSIRGNILKKYPSYVEAILYHSLLKMKQVSLKGIIDYVIVKALKQS